MSRMAHGGGPMAMAGLGRGSAQASAVEDCGRRACSNSSGSPAQRCVWPAWCGPCLRCAWRWRRGAAHAYAEGGGVRACRHGTSPSSHAYGNRAYRPVPVVASEDLQRWQWWRPGTAACPASGAHGGGMARALPPARGGRSGRAALDFFPFSYSICRGGSLHRPPLQIHF